MTRRFNYTGRRRIYHKGAKSEVTISLRTRDVKPPSFDAELNFQRLNLPEDTAILIEAYFRTSYERFTWGTVGSLGPSSDTVLKVVDPEVARFTVKAVDSTGKILARASGIKPELVDEQEGGEERTSLIAVKAVNMDQLWRVSVRPGERPLLEVNKALRIKQKLLDDPLTRGLVFPAALREIVTRYVAVGALDSDDPWARRVVNFLSDLTTEEIPRVYDGDIDDTTTQDWLENVVSNYCQRYNIIHCIPVESI